ncbi:MAG TPA: hypothetical protein QF851_01620 [Flavobacteriales bacterium]|nr:hypothetical protein [Flavobacteriales bacterium]
MNKRTDIENLEKRIPFTVPNGYFQELKFDIQEQCKLEEKSSFISMLKLQIITPVLGIMLVLFTLFNNKTEIYNKEISVIELTDNDILVYLEEDISQGLIYEYTDLEIEEIDEFMMEQYDYNELIYEL